MKKLAFAILVALIMLLLTIGTIPSTASVQKSQASDCVTLSGVVTGTYSTINPCETFTIPLVGANVQITDNTYGQVQTLSTMNEQRVGLFKKLPAGYYAASILKNWEFTIKVTYDAEIDGVPYHFESDEILYTSGESSDTLNIQMHGTIVRSRNYENNFVLQNFIQRFIQRINAVITLF